MAFAWKRIPQNRKPIIKAWLCFQNVRKSVLFYARSAATTQRQAKWERWRKPPGSPEQPEKEEPCPCCLLSCCALWTPTRILFSPPHPPSAYSFPLECVLLEGRPQGGHLVKRNLVEIQTGTWILNIFIRNTKVNCLCENLVEIHPSSCVTKMSNWFLK